MNVPSAVLVFLFALRGNDKQLTNVFRYDRSVPSLHILALGAWVPVWPDHQDLYKQVGALFGVNEATALAEHNAMSLEGLSAQRQATIEMWDRRLAASPLSTVVPADLGLETLTTKIALKNTSIAYSMTKVRCGAVQGFFVEERGINTFATKGQRFVPSDAAAAEKAWSDITPAPGVTPAESDGSALNVEKLRDVLKVQLAANREAQRIAKEAEEEKARVRALEAEEARKREEARLREEAARAEREARARELEQAKRDAELLNLETENLSASDFAKRMRAKRLLSGET